MYTYKYTYAIIELKRKGYIMKLITFSAIKGGVGKTTLAYNYGEWLANKVTYPYYSYFRVDFQFYLIVNYQQ